MSKHEDMNLDLRHLPKKKKKLHTAIYAYNPNIGVRQSGGCWELTDQLD